MSSPSPAPRPPSTLDEELLGAEDLTVLTELTDADRIERMRGELAMGFAALEGLGPAVSVFGSARTRPEHPESALACRTARRLGEEGFAIITGGGPGTMEAANRGAREAGARSVGLAIDLPHEEYVNQSVDLPLRFHYFFTRKVMFVRYASAFVVFPGGFGTLDELFEVLTLIQTAKIRHAPVVLVGEEYWSGLLGWMEAHLARPGRIGARDLELVSVLEDPEAILAAARAGAAARGVEPGPSI